MSFCLCSLHNLVNDSGEIRVDVYTVFPQFGINVCEAVVTKVVRDQIRPELNSTHLIWLVLFRFMGEYVSIQYINASIKIATSIFYI